MTASQYLVRLSGNRHVVLDQQSVSAVSIMAVRTLVTAAEEAGVERQHFLAELGLTTTLLDDGDVRIPLAEYQRVVRAALAATDDPALGLHMGERAGTGSFDVLGHLAEHSATLRESLEMCERYARIARDGPKLELYEQGATATVRFVQLGDELLQVRLIAEFVTTAMLLRLIRRFVPGEAQPEAVFFDYPAPAYRAEYTRIFVGRERFSQPFTGLQFDRSWLDRKQTNYSRELWTLLQSRADLLLAQIEHDVSATERVNRWLAAHILEKKPTVELIARALGMSGRSLRRRLCDEGTLYGDLVEKARAASAIRLLQDRRCSVQQAGYALGFATPAAFTRAFKRWTGVSPSAHRSVR